MEVSVVASPCIGISGTGHALKAMGVPARLNNIFDLDPRYARCLSEHMQLDLLANLFSIFPEPLGSHPSIWPQRRARDQCSDDAYHTHFTVWLCKVLGLHPLLQYLSRAP